MLTINILLDRGVDLRLISSVRLFPRDPAIWCSDLEDAAVRVDMLFALYQVVFEANLGEFLKRGFKHWTHLNLTEQLV